MLNGDKIEFNIDIVDQSYKMEVSGFHNVKDGKVKPTHAGIYTILSKNSSHSNSCVFYTGCGFHICFDVQGLKGSKDMEHGKIKPPLQVFILFYLKTHHMLIFGSLIQDVVFTFVLICRA